MRERIMNYDLETQEEELPSQSILLDFLGALQVNSEVSPTDSSTR
jgi:hypothetical protein